MDLSTLSTSIGLDPPQPPVHSIHQVARVHQETRPEQPILHAHADKKPAYPAHRDRSCRKRVGQRSPRRGGADVHEALPRRPSEPPIQRANERPCAHHEEHVARQPMEEGVDLRGAITAVPRSDRLPLRRGHVGTRRRRRIWRAVREQQRQRLVVVGLDAEGARRGASLSRVAREQRHPQAAVLGAEVSGEPPVHAVVKKHQLRAPSLGTRHAPRQQIARVRIAMHEAKLKDHRREGLAEQRGALAASDGAPREAIGVGQLDAVDPLHREHAPA
mmetsp:Transcript_10707/g.24856  ORF Transcript_10707/g.24856 Transcript_10707/m.24856 type:complete len:274 (-) Transcript_10707:433-1254(-)